MPRTRPTMEKEARTSVREKSIAYVRYSLYSWLFVLGVYLIGLFAGLQRSPIGIAFGILICVSLGLHIIVYLQYRNRKPSSIRLASAAFSEWKKVRIFILVLLLVVSGLETLFLVAKHNNASIVIVIGVGAALSLVLFLISRRYLRHDT